MASRELKVEIIGDSRSLQKALGAAGNSATGFGSKFAKAGKVVGVAALGVGAAVTAGFVYTLKRGFDELADSQKVMAQTGAVLKSTGATANVTAGQVEDLATSLSAMSGTDDEVIQSGENMLLTFTNVRNEVGKGNDVFNQSTKVLLDMSTALGTDMNKSAIQLGKALNDPIKGITALTRVGVTFNEGQRETIKQMVESGNTMGAQKLILAELNKEFGGSAKAFGETMPGQLAKLRNSFDEVAGNLAVKFLPVLTSIVEWVNAHWPEIEAVINAVGTGIMATFQGIGAAVDYLRNQWEIHRESAIATWNAVKTAVLQFIDWFKTNVVPAIQNVVAAATALWDHFGGEIISIGTRLVASIKQTMLNMAAPIRILLALLKGDWGEAWNIAKQVVTGTLGTMLGNIRAAVGGMVSAAVDIGTGIVKGIVDGLGKLASSVAAKMGELLGALLNVANVAYQFAVQIGSKIVSGIWDGFSSLIGGIKDKIAGAIGGILSSIDIPRMSPPEHAAAEAIGKPMANGAVGGFVNQLRNRGPEIGQALKIFTNEAVKAVASSKAAFGAAMGDLLQAGMDAIAQKAAGWVPPSLVKLMAEQDARARKELQDNLDAAAQAVIDTQFKINQAQADLIAPGPPEGMSAEDWEKRKKEAEEFLKTSGADLAAAQKQLDDAEFAVHTQNLQDKAKAEQAAHDKKIEQKQANFAKEMNQLRNQFENEKISFNEFMGSLRKLFKEYGIEALGWGQKIAVGIADGMRSELETVKEAARELGKAIGANLDTSHSPSKEGPLSRLDKWFTNFVPTLLSGLDTRELSRVADSFSAPTFSSMDGRNAVMTGSAGAVAGQTIIVHNHIAGSVLTEQDLASAVQRSIIGKGRISGVGLLGGYA
jgi:hypothetical protein